MEPKRDIFEELIKNALHDMAPEPSPKVWKGISRSMAWKEFVRFDFINFTTNIYQIAAACLVGVSLPAIIFTISIQPTDRELTKQVHPPYDLSPQTPASIIKKAPIDNFQKDQQATPVNSPAPLVHPADAPHEIESTYTLAKPPSTSLEKEIASFRLEPQNAYIEANDKVSIIPLNETSKPAAIQNEAKTSWRWAMEAIWSWNHMKIKYTPDKYNYDFNTLGITLYIQKNHLKIGAGMAYQRLFDRLLYKVNYNTYDSTGFIYNVHYYMPDPANPGTVILITSKETLYDSIKHTINTYTTGTYDYLNLPLSVGYQIITFKHLSVFFEGTATFQFLLKKNEPTPASYNSLKSSLVMEATLPQRKSFMIDLGPGISLEYRILNKVNISATPSLRWWPQSLSDNEQATQPTAWGVKFGFKYNF